MATTTAPSIGATKFNSPVISQNINDTTAAAKKDANKMYINRFISLRNLVLLVFRFFIK